MAINLYQGEWQNETYASLVEGARRVSDQEARMKMYRAADKILVKEVALLPMFYPRNAELVKPWVSTPAHDPTGFFYWKSVVMEEH